MLQIITLLFVLSLVLAIIAGIVSVNKYYDYEEILRKSENDKCCYENHIKILYNEIGEKTKRIAELEDENHGLSDELAIYYEGTGSSKHC